MKKKIMEKNSRIYIAGHNGLVGSAILRLLKKEGYKNLITASHSQLDLTKQNNVEVFMKYVKPEYVFIASAKVGGIYANSTYPAQFVYDNIMIQTNVIHTSYLVGVNKLIFLGSSCIYPRETPQPVKEEYFLTGLLEKTNESYALAKISGIRMCDSYNDQYGCDYLSLMPTNMYGMNDHYPLDDSHVFPAFIRKIHLAKLLMDDNFDALLLDLNRRPISNSNCIVGVENLTREEIIGILSRYGIYSDFVEMWGTGNPRREFMSSEDMAIASLFFMQNVSYKDVKTHINIGTGEDISLAEFAELVADIIGYRGEIRWDTERDDGTPVKRLDVSLATRLGWRAKIKLIDGIRDTYAQYLGGH